MDFTSRGRWAWLSRARGSLASSPGLVNAPPTGHAAVETPSGARRSSLLEIGPAAWMVILCFLTILTQLANPGVTDVGWLIVVAERVLGGERLYVDILEVNPPASLLIYLPTIWLAQVLQVRAEYAILVSLLAGLLLAMWSAGRVLARNNLLPDATAPLVAAMIAFGAIAGNSYAQREHVALVLMLPMLALVAARTLPDTRIFRAQALGVGLAAGIAVSIKPHFAAAILLPQLYGVWRARSLRPLLNIENVAIATTLGVYAAIVLIVYPDYLRDLLPVVLETYRPARVRTSDIAEMVAPFAFWTAIYLVGIGARAKTATMAVPLLAALGFLVGVFEQSKGWQYHYYPAVALFLFVLLRDVLETLPRILRGHERPGPATSLAVVALLALAFISYKRFEPYPQISQSLEPAIRQISERPTMLAVTGDLGVTHPLTRRVNGIWVGTTASLWISENAYLLLEYEPDVTPEQRRRLQDWIRMDREIFVADLRKHAPEILLVDMRLEFWQTWMQEDPTLMHLFAKYALEAKNREVELYVRRDLKSAPRG